MDESAHTVEKAKAYQKKKQFLTLFHLVLTPCVLLLAVATPLSLLFKGWASSFNLSPGMTVALYFSLFSLYLLVFDLPFSFYAGFVLEHRFGLSNQNLRSWVVDFLKKTLLSFALSLSLIVGLYALIWRFPENWWLFAWAAYAVVRYVMGKLFPVLIVPLFYQYSRVEDPLLRERIVALASRFGLPVENVYSLNLSRTTKKANAAFMGLGKTKRVVLSDTLLEDFNPDEIEVVVAHELGHFKHCDIWRQFAFGTLTSFVIFWIAASVMDPLSSALGYGGINDLAALPVLFLLFYVAALFLMPLQNGFSRWLERAADRFALEAFSYPQVFISCMEKLGRLNLADPDPHPVYEWFFYDHPAIVRRIRMAKQWRGPVGKESGA